MDCKDCKEKKDVNPYFGQDAALDHMARIVRWLVIALMLSWLVFGACCVYWTNAWTSYDYTGSEEVTVDGQNGVASYAGNDGRLIIYGECQDPEDQNQNP